MSITDFSLNPQKRQKHGFCVVTNFANTKGPQRREFHYFPPDQQAEAYALEARWQAHRLRQSPSLTEVPGLYCCIFKVKRKATEQPYNAAAIVGKVRGLGGQEPFEARRQVSANASISQVWQDLTLRLARYHAIARPSWWVQSCPTVAQFERLIAHYETTGRPVDEGVVKGLWQGGGSG